MGARTMEVVAMYIMEGAKRAREGVVTLGVESEYRVYQERHGRTCASTFGTT
jgi:hypothetical protein